MEFQKTCFKCGKKTSNLIQNLCKNCFFKENSPISEIKKINFTVCNMCGKIHYKNTLYSLLEIENKLPTIIRNNLKLKDGYILKDMQINNFEKDGHNLDFEIVFDFDLRE